MKNKILLFAATVMVLMAGCVKEPVPIDPVVEEEFNWTTFATKSLTFDVTSDVLNQNGEYVARNMDPGTYNFKVGANDIIHAVLAGSATKAAGDRIVSFPAEGKYTTVMVEDLYPYMGDYDFNDIVFGLGIDLTLNAKNMVTYMTFRLKPLAAGSSSEKIGVSVYFRGASLGFGMLTGQPANVTELFQGRMESCDEGMTLPLTGNFKSHFNGYVPNSPEGAFVNTANLKPYYAGESIIISYNLGLGVPYNSISLFGTDKSKSIVDVFVVVGERGHEIHLKGQEPTSLNTIKSKEAPNYEKDGYVWMMMTDTPIHYPKEQTSIEVAYPQFTSWVSSQGASNTDWYNYPAVPFDPAKTIRTYPQSDDNLLYQYFE